MKKFIIVASLIAISLSAVSANDQRARVLMQAAEAKATIEGDLTAAIKLYKDAEKEAGPNRALVAQALVKMAEAYQALGDAEAQKIYQRVVRQFSDQKEPFTIARGRLTSAAPVSAATALKGDRAVWTGPDVDLFGTVSPDGRFVTYVDWRGARNVMIRDLVTGLSRSLTENTVDRRVGTADFSVISRDGRQVAYWWSTQPSGEFRVASLESSSNAHTRVVRTGSYVRPYDWAPDNSSIAALIDDAHIGIVSMKDGSVRQLKSVDWNGVGKMTFSPDGRYLAYDLASAERVGRRDIRVLAVDGSSDVVVVADAFRNHMMAWSSAGDLVYSSDRTGTRSLWTVRMVNGRVTGEPRLAKENVRSTFSMGLTPTGTLYVWQPASPSYVGVEPFDPERGRIIKGQGGSFQQFIESRGWPRWSPDGRRLAFISCGLTGGGPCALFVRDGQGAPREVRHSMWYMFAPEFSPDGEKIIARGTDLNDRGGLFIIDVATGATSMFVAHDTTGLRFPRDPTWSADGNAVFYIATDGDETSGSAHFVVIRRGISANAESTEVFRTPAGHISWMSVSPDERHVAVIQRSGGDFVSQPGTLFVTSLPGGPRRAVYSARGLDAEQWGADSQSVIAHTHSAERVEIWRVPLAGTPSRLELDGGGTREMFQLSPDGKHVAFKAQVGEAGDQIWALENFLPTR
jgi:Tol biopolymer transport system component